MKRSRALLSIAAIAVVTSAIGSGSAFAAWSATGQGGAAAASTSMPAGNAPAVSASGSSVSLRWAAASFPNGTPVQGYIVNRYDANGSPQTVGAGCSGTVTTTTCTETNVPAGQWTYTDTPVQLTWTGQESPPSNAVTAT